MRSSLAFVALCAFVGLAFASTCQSPDDLWREIPDFPIQDYHEFSFMISLEPRNIDLLDEMFWQISNPEHPLYGKFLSNEQIADLASSPEADIKKVTDFLQADSGKFCDVEVELGIHRDVIFVNTCAAQAKEIFPDLQLTVYESQSGLKFLRSTVLIDPAHNKTLLGVPDELHELIFGIHDVTEKPHVSLAAASTKVNPATTNWLNSDKELTIPDMISEFGIDFSVFDDSSFTADNGQVRAAVVEYNQNGFGAKELATFQKKYNIPSNPIKKVIGQQNTMSYNGEASLDVQTITSIAQGVEVWDFVQGYQNNYVLAVDTIMKTPGAPRVVSVSYGLPENSLGNTNMTLVNNAFMKFGLAGYSLFFASGDVGPMLNQFQCNIFDATFPATSPYTVAVGGATVNKATGGQRAWIHSGGGFSPFNKQPPFQKSFVSNYLSEAKNKLPANAQNQSYNTNNRAYPDVSGFGAFEPVYVNGSWDLAGGTSGAAPQFAAVVALLNVYRYQNGLGPLGPLNYALYHLKEGVGLDIVNGQTFATSRSGCQGYLPGFYAAQGWDPATGLGTPKWDTLLSGLGNLQSTWKMCSEEIVSQASDDEFAYLNQ